MNGIGINESTLFTPGVKRKLRRPVTNRPIARATKKGGKRAWI